MSAEKLPVKVVLTDAFEEDVTAEVPIATSNPLRPTVYATENLLEKLSNRLQNDVHMLPEGAVRRWKTEMQILLGSSKTGLIYMATSLAETLDLQLKDTNIDGVVFDACVIACDHPVQILTFVRSVSKDKFDTLIQRNDELSKGVLYSLREFTDEKFNILNGVLDLDDLRDSAGFEDKRYKMFGKRSLYVNPRSLQMNPSKCRHLCKAFFVAAAVDHTSTSSDKIVLLKWDDYQLLETYLDEPNVIVNYTSEERVAGLMKEVARRLSRSGKTVHTEKTQRGDTVLACFEDDASSQMQASNGRSWLFRYSSNGNPYDYLTGSPDAGILPSCDEGSIKSNSNEDSMHRTRSAVSIDMDSFRNCPRASVWPSVCGSGVRPKTKRSGKVLSDTSQGYDGQVNKSRKVQVDNHSTERKPGLNGHTYRKMDAFLHH
ncbi:uncharacterized protein [Haliotis cracherodii]|uniref:uncharacterized protein n=1 Tax=Haliotis cracherodii TaxID=6455 RepID=UPI0039ECFB62